MNISPLTIYLWQLADKLTFSLGPLWFFATLSFIIFAIYNLIARHDDEEEHIKCSGEGLRFSSVLAVLFFLGYTLIPSSNTVAMMVIVPRIAESKALQQDLPDIYNAAVKALKDQLAK